MNASMRLGMLAVVSAALLTVPYIAHADGATTQPAVSAAQIKALVAQLGDDSATKRDDAFGRLKAIGGAAMADLRVAAQSKDPEVASRAKQLLEMIPKIVIEQCLAWKAEVPGRVSQPIVLTKDLMLVSSGDSKIHALDLASGKHKWECASGCQAETARMCAWGDNLFVYSPNLAVMQSISLSKGQQLWKLEGATVADCHVTGDNMLCLDSKGQVVCIAPSDGKEVYKLDAATLMKDVKSPRIIGIRAAGDLTLITISHGVKDPWGNTSVVAVKSATGEKVWSVDREKALLNCMAVTEGKIYALFAGATKGLTLATIDAKSGKAEDIALPIGSDLSPHGQNIKIKLYEGRLICSVGTHTAAYDLKEIKDSRTQWTYEAPTPDATNRVTNGTRTARYVLPSEQPSVIDDGRLIIGGFDGLIGLDTKTGQGLWKYPLNRPVAAGPLIQDGKAYFVESAQTWRGDASKDSSTVYALDLSKTRLLDAPGPTPPANARPGPIIQGIIKGAIQPVPAPVAPVIIAVPLVPIQDQPASAPADKAK